MSAFFTFCWIACSIVCWVLYHKLFTVYYTNLGMGLVGEFISCFLIGGVITALLATFWFITIPVIVLIIFFMYKKAG